MRIDPSTIDALLAAVTAAPEQLALRANLASLLLASDRAGEALEHAAQVLAREPDHLEALQVAAKAAEAVGDSRRAASYRRLLEALGAGGPATAPRPGSRPESPAAGASPSAQGAGASPPSRLPAVGPRPSPPEDSPASGGGTDDPELEEDFEDDDADEEAPKPRAAGLRLVAEDGELVAGAVEKPALTLADVGGLESVKKRLERAFLGPLKHPELRAYFGKSLRGGLLLFGPPGCGKTFIARATAGELGARFLSVGLTDVLDMWLGNSEKNLHAIFEEARRNAPCVVFFDELDALGRKRSLMRHGAGSGAVAQLLAELDGIGADNQGVFVLAATNHPWDVDPALRRPGRFDRTVAVLPPDPPARQAILELHLRERPVEPGISLASLVKRTEQFSGADLAHLCDAAAELALEASLEAGKPRPIRLDDLEAARKQLTPSTRAWFETARPFAQFANEGGLYDELLTYLREHKLG